MTKRDPLFGDSKKSFEAVASEINSAASGAARSPINNKEMKPYKCGDIPVMADLESRVVFPQFE